jgi:hypothetical protein
MRNKSDGLQGPHVWADSPIAWASIILENSVAPRSSGGQAAHVKRVCQFGGFSGPDGLGVALRGLLRVLDYVGIGYHLRDFDDMRSERGF